MGGSPCLCSTTNRCWSPKYSLIACMPDETTIATIAGMGAGAAAAAMAALRLVDAAQPAHRHFSAAVADMVGAPDRGPGPSLIPAVLCVFFSLSAYRSMCVCDGATQRTARCTAGAAAALACSGTA